MDDGEGLTVGVKVDGVGVRDLVRVEREAVKLALADALPDSDLEGGLPVRDETVYRDLVRDRLMVRVSVAVADISSDVLLECDTLCDSEAVGTTVKDGVTECDVLRVPVPVKARDADAEELSDGEAEPDGLGDGVDRVYEADGGVCVRLWLLGDAVADNEVVALERLMEGVLEGLQVPETVRPGVVLPVAEPLRVGVADGGEGVAVPERVLGLRLRVCDPAVNVLMVGETDPPEGVPDPVRVGLWLPGVGVAESSAVPERVRLGDSVWEDPVRDVVWLQVTLRVGEGGVGVALTDSVVVREDMVGLGEGVSEGVGLPGLRVWVHWEEREEVAVRLGEKVELVVEVGVMVTAGVGLEVPVKVRVSV